MYRLKFEESQNLSPSFFFLFSKLFLIWFPNFQWDAFSPLSEWMILRELNARHVPDVWFGFQLEMLDNPAVDF